MAFSNNQPGSLSEIEQQTRDFAYSLNEKDRRRFVALQAKSFGHGGIAWICGIVGCSRHTVENGFKELDSLADDPVRGRVRRPGAGRKKKLESDSQAEENLISKLDVRTAGSPDQEDVIFTDLKPPQLSIEMAKMGTPVSPQPISDWLRDAGVRLRSIAKTIAGGQSEDRNTQFVNIGDLIDRYESEGNPWFSIDTKAKEHLGMLYRKGRSYCSRPFQAFDHDFPSWAEGVVIPHGIYDRKLNLGHINLGLYCDTSEFACDSIRHFWNAFGKRRYPNATSIMLTCDCGGSNSATKHLFKYDLQRLANSIRLPIRIAHYPSYCSKYNPIERRFFPYIGQACEGKLFDSIARVVQLMRRATTSSGLRTTIHVIDKLYETGRVATDAMKQTLNIVHDELVPKWNYVAKPVCASN